MKLCEHDCIPCCMFCKYMIPDIENSINFGPKGCSLHSDEEHQEIVAVRKWVEQLADYKDVALEDKVPFTKK